MSYTNLRKMEREARSHPDLIIKSTYNPNAEFCIRCVRPKIIYDPTIHLKITPNDRVYSIQPLVKGVLRRFEKVNWERYWEGVGMPQVKIDGVIQAYVDCEPYHNFRLKEEKV